jgi:PAS domain S-box-containing protein
MHSQTFTDINENNFLLQIFLNNTDNSFILTDSELRIIFFNKLANERAVEFLNFPLKEGMPLIELASPDRKEQQLTLLKETISGTKNETEYHIALPGNDFVCFHNSYHPARNGDGEIVGVLVTSKNITNRKKREEDLRISNERYRLINQATSDAIWDYDVSTGNVYFNESFTRYFGHQLAASENGYDLWEKHIHPDDKDRVIYKINTAISGSGTHWEDEYRFLTNEGDIVYVYDRGIILRNESGEPLRMIGSMRDITAQKENELKIALSEHRFKSLVQTGTDLIGIVDQYGNYTYVSPTVAQLGYDQDFLLGKNAFDFIHPSDVETAAGYFQSVLLEQQVLVPAFRFRNANNEWRWVETIATNMIDDPTINGIVVNSRDITEKKLKDEALSKVLNDLNKILDSSVDVIVVTDENNRYVQVSAAAETLWGYKPAELIGKVCLDLVHPDDRKYTDVETKKVMQGVKITNFQNRYVRKDGTVVPLIWSARWDENEKVMYAIARDATEKIEAEKAIKISEERYRELFENNPIPMFMFDLNSGNMVMVNGAALNLYGYSESEFLEKKVTDIRPEAELPRFFEYLDQVKEKHEMRYAGEWKHRKKDGTIFEVEVRSHNLVREGRLCRLSVIYDVTERNNARAELQKSEAMFRAISESFPNGIVSILDKDLRFEYVAGQELESLDIPPSFFVGKLYTQHFPDDDLAIRTTADRIFAGETVVSEIKFFNRNYLLSSVPLYEHDGSIQHILVVAQNITAQKEIQKEKELLIIELTKNIQDLRQFSYITSHNLRAPISNLIGIMGLINMDLIKDPDTHFLVQKFKESTLLLNDTVNDLLNILLIKNNVNVRREVFPLHQVWEDVCTSVNSQIRNAGAKIISSIPRDEVVSFNKSYMESILLNLLTNSLKYRDKDRQLVVELSSVKDDDYLILQFRDNGIGINMEHHRDKIFGLYQRFHNYPDSKGLGLYIVHSQITALGGKIEVESEAGKGTCFKLYFKQ